MAGNARSRAVRRRAAFVLAMVLGSALAAASSEDSPDEYQVKAAFLVNFVRFVDWPAASFKNASEPFSICLLDEDPFGRALNDLTGGKSTGGRPIAVHRTSDVRQASGCQMLFVSSTAGNRVLSAITAAKQTGILTVGDSGIPASEGMIVHFVMENGKVRFEINTAAADRAELHISAKLLSLARVFRK